MIQHLSNLRTDKQLTVDDMKRIFYACSLNLFNNLGMFKPHSLGIFPNICFYYVMRKGSDSYYYQTGLLKADGGDNGGIIAGVGYLIAARTVSYSAMISKCPSLDNPDMVLDKGGDSKLLIEYFYGASSSFDKNKLGFFILTPKLGNNSRYGSYRGNFAYRLVITPKPGLFPVKT